MQQFVAASTARGNISRDHSFSVDELICEVINNGFEQDLCLNSNDFKNKQYSLLSVVNAKLQSKIYKMNYLNTFGCWYGRKYMLSLLLYTGCNCNYDLCKSQRNGDYDKWPHFDACLYNAIKIMSQSENYSTLSNDMPFHLYSGLRQVQLKNQNKIDAFYFPTYISTSYNKFVSKEFAQNNGMLMQFDSNTI